jgi:hypothetical protein
VDYETAKKLLRTPIVASFSKTNFRNAELRREALLWAMSLPSGRSLDSQIESVYHTTYGGSTIKFGKPGKEASRQRNPNQYDMTPILYEKRAKQLARTTKGFNFLDLLEDISTKINREEEAGHVLLAMLYRCGVLDDHAITNGKLCYNPNTDVMQWLDERFRSIGDTPPSELIPIYDAIMLNDDIKLYTNPKRYDSSHLEPYDARGRVNTMGAIFAICAPEKTLSRIRLASLLIRGRGTPRIFSKDYEYGRQIVAPMTGEIVNSYSNQTRLS